MGTKKYNANYFNTMVSRELKRVTLLIHPGDVEQFKRAAKTSRERSYKADFHPSDADMANFAQQDKEALEEYEADQAFKASEKIRIARERKEGLAELEAYKKLNGFK